MANSPRKPNSPRPPKDAASTAEDLFASHQTDPAPAPGSVSPPPEDDDDWQLEEPRDKPAGAPPKPRIAPLSTQPIPAPESHSFESNLNIPAAVPLAIPRHSAPVPPPASASPAPGPVEEIDPFDIDDDLTLESRPRPAAAPPSIGTASPADDPQPRYNLGKITSSKSAAATAGGTSPVPNATGGQNADADADSTVESKSRSKSNPDSDSHADFQSSEADADALADSDPDSDSESTPKSGSPTPLGTKAGLLTAAAVLLALLAIFAGVLYSHRPAIPSGTAKSSPSLPLTGKIVTITELKSGWRARQPGDLVSNVDVTLPVATRLQSEFVPEVQFTCDPAASKPGFLRFIFIDPDRKISGDVRVVKLANGTIEPLSSGAIVSGPGATVYGSFGFLDRPAFVSYASNEDQRWSVEISESSDYNAKEKDWTLLDTLDIRNTTLP
ncbi:MAG: hypothetical protein JWL81_2283 [Verrucomicrobiales bacterium]|nr:hypothetical protein [Verrucomicrobiales bacterium]